MKLIDRYLFGVFISAFFIFLLTFVSLFLVVDFSTRLNRFLLLPESEIAGFIAKYYLLRLPLFLLYVLPTVTLFASMFSFVKLQKTNELVPIVTSGISLRRLSLPFAVAAAATSLLAFSLDEFALPRLMPEIDSRRALDDPSRTTRFKLPTVSTPQRHVRRVQLLPKKEFSRRVRPKASGFQRAMGGAPLERVRAASLRSAA